MTVKLAKLCCHGWNIWRRTELSSYCRKGTRWSRLWCSKLKKISQKEIKKCMYTMNRQWCPRERPLGKTPWPGWVYRGLRCLGKTPQIAVSALGGFYLEHHSRSIVYILSLKYSKGVDFGKVFQVFLRKLKYLCCRNYAELALFYYNFHLLCTWRYFNKTIVVYVHLINKIWAIFRFEYINKGWIRCSSHTRKWIHS